MGAEGKPFKTNIYSNLSRPCANTLCGSHAATIHTAPHPLEIYWRFVCATDTHLTGFDRFPPLHCCAVPAPCVPRLCTETFHRKITWQALRVIRCHASLLNAERLKTLDGQA